MIRIVVIYRDPADETFRARYAQHVELCRAVPGLSAFRYGPVFGAPRGESERTWMAEFEFADRASFDAALTSPEMRATAIDARELGGEAELFFAELHA
jgi:uncharacterized protein (TIGR02118 family)